MKLFEFDGLAHDCIHSNDLAVDKNMILLIEWSVSWFIVYGILQHRWFIVYGILQHRQLAEPMLTKIHEAIWYPWAPVS